MLRIVTPLLALLVGSADHSKPASKVLLPTGPWSVDYADSSCVLGRSFAAADDIFHFALTFEPIQRSAWLRISSRDAVNRRDDGNAKVEVDSIPLKRPVHFNIFPERSGDVIREFLFEDFRKDAGVAQQSLRFRLPRYGDLTLSVPDFSKAMLAMDACLTDLYRSFGIDPAVLKTIAVQPVGTMGDFVKIPAFDDKLDITLLYWVNPQGRVDECRVLSPSGQKAFDNGVCDNLKRTGKYRPARNAAGVAVRAPVYENMRMRKIVILGSAAGAQRSSTQLSAPPRPS